MSPRLKQNAALRQAQAPASTLRTRRAFRSSAQRRCSRNIDQAEKAVSAFLLPVDVYARLCLSSKVISEKTWRCDGSSVSNAFFMEPFDTVSLAQANNPTLPRSDPLNPNTIVIDEPGRDAMPGWLERPRSATPPRKSAKQAYPSRHRRLEDCARNAELMQGRRQRQSRDAASGASRL
jgi:hypothetical protein